MHLSKYAAELTLLLSTSKWKSVIELTDEMNKKWEEEGKQSIFNHIISFFSPSLGRILREPSVGGIYVGLEELAAQDFAEWRWREDPTRKTGRRMEWRITEEGRRVQALIPSAQKDGDGFLIPSPA